ncbi:hypothetical protein C8P63_13719 [Melghirimyces profundicolus]|uniref:Uncharacterized protein n=1 Tax=Melghirimyces profundicolus TaxID=1242148 RepID=A0A2T6B2U9_9BACL|nr:hypothetical protein C8P63_13719 [Melghirimyces profundicolus]
MKKEDIGKELLCMIGGLILAGAILFVSSFSD